MITVPPGRPSGLASKGEIEDAPEDGLRNAAALV